MPQNIETQLLEAMRENNSLLSQLILSHPNTIQKINAHDAQRWKDTMRLQEEWANKYGEVVPGNVAAKIIGRTQGCIVKWANEGRIVRAEGGGIFVRSLAAYMSTGTPQGDFKHDPIHPIKRPQYGRSAAE